MRRLTCRNPRLLSLAAEAKRRGLPFLWDDADVIVGTGKGSVSYPIGALPEVADVAWGTLGAVPIALVTGSFGPWKSVYNRFNNWAKKGQWEAIFKALRLEVDEVGSIVDGSVVRAARSSFVDGRRVRALLDLSAMSAP